jgi:hypothetical protein
MTSGLDEMTQVGLGTPLALNMCGPIFLNGSNSPAPATSNYGMGDHFDGDQTTSMA